MGKTNKSSNIIGEESPDNRYDAIVIGSGMSGGWAAKELCEKGLKTLVLERGRNVEHIKDYPTANYESWDFPHRGQLPYKITSENPIVSKCYAYGEDTEHFFVKDREHPYEQIKPFDWIRGYQVGGKSLMWARMVQRWGVHDFLENKKDGYGTDWPIRYEDLAPWYSHVEKFIGVSGNADGLPQIPDGEFLPPMPLNCLEDHFRASVEQQFPGRNVVAGRTANLSQSHKGRGQCQYRNRCQRGCPYGAYFSSNSSTLPAAMATENLTMRTHAVVHSIIYDEEKQKATGVRVIDANTKEVTEYFSRIVFCNAGTVNSTLILLNSTSNRFPNGLGNDYDILGRYLMAHNYRGRVSGSFDGLQDRYYYGRKPTSGYIPRFRNFGNDKQDAYLRGFAYTVHASRGRGHFTERTPAFGAEFKDALTDVGAWGLGLTGMGECLPYKENRITLSNDKTDDWGMPLAQIDCEWKENEDNMVEDILNSGAEMLEAAGFRNINTSDSKQAPGLDIHEMGTARMGKDPKTSMLNGLNQIHSVKNVFVSDGAAMASTACQNPSLTYMALTARAVDLAIAEMKKQNI